MICYTLITILSLLCVLTLSMNVSDAYDYVLLITDVHSYYRTTCIVIVHSERYTDFHETTLMQVWSRSLSHKGILTTITSFPELLRQNKRYQGYITRPLYVVLLTARETMDEFVTATRQIDISFPVWLVLFLPYRENPLRPVCRNPVGNPFELTFNTEMLVLCYEQPILREWYALRDNRTRFFNLATWKTGEAVHFLAKRELHGKRGDMLGDTIRVAIVEKSPFVAVKDGVLSLFLGELVRELSNAMNFTINVTSCMATYGGWDPKKQMWTGVIGEVASRKVDFGVSEFSISEHRLDAVDFTTSLILTQNRIYFKKPDVSSVQWSAYFKTFHANIWTAIVCIIASSPILLTVMKTRGRVTMEVLADNYIYVWGIYCQQGLSEFPDETSMRLAFLSIFVSALITLSAYSGSLISYLTVSTVSLPFSTLEGFVADGTYGLTTLKNSADYDMIISETDGAFSKLKNVLKKKQDLAVTVNDGFLQVCSEKVGFYISQVLKEAVDFIPCEVVDIEVARFDSLALVLSKHSPYTDLINYHLQRFKDNGVLQKLKNTFLKTSRSNSNGYAKVTLYSIAPILAVLAGGIILACVVLSLEKTYRILCDGQLTGTCQFSFCRSFLQRALCTSRKGKPERALSFVKKDNELKIPAYSNHRRQ